MKGKEKRYKNHHPIWYNCPICGESIIGCFLVSCNDCEMKNASLECSKSNWFGESKFEKRHTVNDAVACKCHPQLVIGYLISELIEKEHELSTVLDKLSDMEAMISYYV